MDLYHNALSFTGTFMLLIVFALYLRYRGIISNNDSPTIARLTIDFILPCLLLSKLPYIKPTAEVLWASLCIFITEFLIAIAALVAGKLFLKLPKPSLAVFILCSTFGSTAILGAAFLTAVFHNDTTSVAFGLLVSQMSVGIPAYFLMPAVSFYFTDESNARFDIITICKEIMLSPCVIAIVIGISWSIFDFPTSGDLLTPYFNALGYVGNTLVFMIAILNGLALQKINIKSEYTVIISTAIFALVLEPIGVYWLDRFFDIPAKDMQISFILSAMPSANSAIAYAVRYKTDVKLAATLVTSTALFSTFSIPTIMGFFPIFS